MSNCFKIVISVLILVSTISSPVYAIGMGHDDNGNYLIDSNEMALYYFVNDDPYSGISNCYGSCESNWRPVSDRNIDSPLRSEDFGGITRSDGSFQTTYKGRPLYHYEKDKKGEKPSGDGQYDLWFVMRL